MARKYYDGKLLARVRELPLSLVFDKLCDNFHFFYQYDVNFVPKIDKQTVRLFLSSPSGLVWEILVTGIKWFDVRAEKGGGGSIDLVMHILDVDFIRAVRFLSVSDRVVSRRRTAKS